MEGSWMYATLRSALVAAALGAATAPFVAAIVPAVQAQNAPAAVGIDNFTFNPQRLTVKAGTTVIWTNKDDIPHAIAAVDKSFKSKVLDTEGAFSFTFATPGTYQYFCSLHPHMTGAIVVEAAASDATR
jgi:plastocyanin